MNDSIRVYGADWCGDTIRTKRFLDNRGLDYEFIDVDEDDTASDRVIQFNGGKRRIPMVEIGQDTLSVPSDAELASRLTRK